ncbi:XRE family transcriptional regulator [Bradyrhizobium sp. SSUT18]|uniref:XRE family transcriptional regulator n=1 Tax=Bradyrhizobium sp. SSUT18 TaxID=3040602 RepID=UPI00244932E2|nr:XRE family transcriptional regulator [Bradyrhizobium sp. SSUT18]MDH2402411.1 XRE family transcriptional regulator [Bradyrhizobium sp. SSUT18]
MRRADAAAYIGVGVSKFDQLVADGRMPQPKRVDNCVIWDRDELDAAFDDLGGSGSAPTGWDAVQ